MERGDQKTYRVSDLVDEERRRALKREGPREITGCRSRESAMFIFLHTQKKERLFLSSSFPVYIFCNSIIKKEPTLSLVFWGAAEFDPKQKHNNEMSDSQVLAS